MDRQEMKSNKDVVYKAPEEISVFDVAYYPIYCQARRANVKSWGCLEKDHVSLCCEMPDVECLNCALRNRRNVSVEQFLDQAIIDTKYYLARRANSHV
jgi:hypothetical protein